MSDYLIQKLADRADIYHRAPGIWYSEELSRWMVTSPELVREAMYDDAFAVPSYDVSPVSDKLGIDLGHLKEMRRWFPLATEGEPHAVLREKFARHIARLTPAALAAMSAELERRTEELGARPAGEEFCIYASLLRPVLMKLVGVLSGAELGDAMAVESIPQLFDGAISPTRRKRINKLVGEIHASMPETMSSDDRYMGCAIIALSANTLLGSISLTVLEGFRTSPRQFLPAVAWPADLVRTGLPLIEKKAVRDTTLGPFAIGKDSRVRLFVESDGVLPGDIYRYSDLFFAVGIHRCIGMNISRQVWAKLAQVLPRIRRTLTILSVTERTGDYVFNYPEAIRARFDD